MHIVTEQEINIRTAMEEQGHGSRQILEAIGKLNELTQMVKQGSVEMLEDSKEVIQESKNLEHVTMKITEGMNEMSTDADEISTAINEVNGISKVNRECIDNLFTEVSKFKVDNNPGK